MCHSYTSKHFANDEPVVEFIQPLYVPVITMPQTRHTAPAARFKPMNHPLTYLWERRHKRTVLHTGAANNHIESSGYLALSQRGYNLGTDDTSVGSHDDDGAFDHHLAVNI